MEKTVRFTHLGETYEMTEQQIEAAFRYQTRQYMKEDAKSQIDQFIYGDDPANLSQIDREMQEEYFKGQYGMDATEAYKLIDKILDRYDKVESCDVDENTTWQNAIREVLTEE